MNMNNNIILCQFVFKLNCYLVIRVFLSLSSESEDVLEEFWHRWHDDLELLLNTLLKSSEDFSKWPFFLHVGGILLLVDVLMHLMHSEFLCLGVEVNLLVEVPHRLTHLSHDVGGLTNLIDNLIVSVALVFGPENVPDVDSLRNKWDGILNNVSCDSLVNLADLDVVHAPIVSEVHILVDLAVLDVLEDHVPDAVGDFL